MIWRLLRQRSERVLESYQRPEQAHRHDSGKSFIGGQFPPR